MGGSPKTPSQTTQTTTSEPPAYAAPGLRLAADAAVRQFQGAAPTYFPDSTVVPFAPETEQALQLTRERALEGSPLVNQAQQTAQEIAAGRGINPYLSGAVQAATAPLFEQFQQETIPTLRSVFERAGRTGSPASMDAAERAATALGRGVSEQAAQLAYNTAEQEATRQVGALQLAPELSRQDYINLESLAKVGATREDLATAQLQEEIDRFNFSQQLESARINELINQLTSATQGQGVSSVTAPGTVNRGPSRLATGLGGAAAGAAAGAQIGSVFPGYGTAIGAVAGGILGGLGGSLR